MKRLFEVLALFMMIQVPSIAQNDIPAFNSYHKNIYMEAEGSFIRAGVNFDMRLEKGRLDGMGFRLGIGGFSGDAGGYGRYIEGMVIFPLEFNYLVGSGRNTLVAGVGMMPAYASVEVIENVDVSINGFGFAGAFVNFGYRLQPRDRGFMFQVNWNPILLRGRGFEYASFGIGMGIGFK